jgi:DNA-binding SARP family transcriptional activator
VAKAVAKKNDQHPAQASTPGRLEFRLFGHLEVTLDGRPFKLATPRKSLQVLAYLLLHRGTAVSREYLAFLLYPDDEENAARAKLRATLSDLVKTLPQPASQYVMVDTDKVSWNPSTEVWLDVDVFDDAATNRRRLAEAIDLYRDDLLPEIYDEWFEAIRERHRNTYLRCLTERVAEARRNADLALAIETARKVLAIDPWREDVVRRIIAMRYEAGDRAGALQEYTSFTKRLQEEMGAKPMAETTAVAERIAKDESPGDDEDEPARSVAANGAAILPFVGRRDEMERLLEMWTRTAGKRGACAFVGGEAGIGKSRLVLEFARAVEDRGGRVLSGTTSAPEAVPYECIVEAMRSALPLVAALKPTIELACIAALLPELHARAELPNVPRLDAESERIRLFESLFRCAASMATPRPMLLILEDVHLAQAASLELLQYLLRRISGLPVMVVLTYRDDEGSQQHSLHRLRREARVSVGSQSLWLSRLSESEVEELRITVTEATGRSAKSLVAASNGNPLFLTQIVSDAREGEPAAEPASLQQVVARRIERLSEPARTVAEIAACIGDRFSRDTVREVSAWDEPALNDALDELLDRRIVREAGGRGLLEYAFTHNLMLEVVAQSVAPKDAAVRRRRIARVLEELYPERFSEFSPVLAAHYECAGDTANAARCYLEAIRRSIAIGAPEEARALCARALALDLQKKVRTELLLEAVTIAARLNDRERRSEALCELEGLARELGNRAILQETLLQQIEFASATGDAEAQEVAVRALRDAVTEGDDAADAVASLAEARVELTYGRLAQAFDAAHAALRGSRAAADEPGTVRALCFLAKVEGYRGNLKSATALFDQAAQVAALAADPTLELLALGSGWVVAYQHRDMARGRALAERSVSVAVKMGDRPSEAQAFGRLGISLLASDAQIADARRYFAAAVRTYEESGDKIGTAAQAMNQSVLEARIGFFDRAVAATEKALRLFEEAVDVRGRLGALANLIYLRACAADVRGAHDAADRALDDVRLHGFGLLEASVLENLAFAEGSVGNFDRAIELAETSFEVRSRSESMVWSSKTLADVAIWYANRGKLDSALDAVTRLLADDDAIVRGADWPSYCYWAAAQVLHFAGRAGEAARPLAKANRLMRESAANLEPEDRAQFLGLPFHVDLRGAVESGAWPDPPR